MHKIKIVSKGDDEESIIGGSLLGSIGKVLLKLLFWLLSVGPVPSHIAFIMDGNRRYAKKRNLTEGGGHSAGFLAVGRMLKYCYFLGVKYVTVYAFSIDNFKRKPHEVTILMNMMQEKIEKLVEAQGLAHQFGIRVHFSGNVNLLSEPVKKAMDRVMAETANNTKMVLSICIAYTSTDEITTSVSQCYEQKTKGRLRNGVSSSGYFPIEMDDVERNMDMAVAPDPEIVVRTSGETRLSNFLLWQSGSSLLYSPAALWPEIGLLHLVWAVVNYQRSFSYLEGCKKHV